MTSLEFEDALKERDNDASNLRLCKLVANGVFSDKDLPPVAEKYLRAFCSATLSHTRRRWVGIALAAMLDSSAEVARHMVSVEHELQGMGNVILSTTEREETKIVAGIIMRQALEQHIELKSFWASDKLRQSATNFPVNTGPNWMKSFQSFLDTLGDLHLAANPITDPCIIYPVSLVGSDGYQWGSIDRGNPIVLAQYDLLTVLMPDELLKKIQFLDVPIVNIYTTKTRPSAPLHDSQSRAIDHEPWDLVMTFKARTNSYRLNSSERTATELSITCQEERDAREIELAIEELRQRQSPKAQQSDSNFRDKHLVCRSSPIAITQQQRNKSTSTSSDQLGKSPVESPQWPTPVLGRESHPDTRRDSSKVSKPIPEAAVHELSEPAQDQADTAAAQSVEEVEPLQRDTDTKSALKLKNADAIQPEKSTGNMQQNVPGSTTRVTRKRAQIESMQSSRSISQAPTTPPSAMNSIAATQPMAKRSTYSKGKLPKVTKATKKKAAQQFRKQPDVFDIPMQGGKRRVAKQQVILEEASDEEPNVRARSKRTNAATQVRPNIDQGKKTRSKLSVEEDDEFVPGATKSTKKVSTKRKSAADADAVTEKSRKKVKTKQRSSAANGPDQTRLQHDTKPSRRLEPMNLYKINSSIAASQTSFIEGLLGSQNPSATRTPFKVPAVPSRSPHPPSTPTQRRHIPVQPKHQPHTPTGLRRPPKTPATLIPSSPPFINIGNEDSVRQQNGAANTEILSSNSKPTPASPNADSTAISGHADRDEIDFEKLTAEIQTARLDPFKQRREGGKATSFIRRLTGDRSLGEGVDEVNKLSHSNPPDVGEHIDSDVVLLPVKAARQPLPQPWSNGDRRKSPHLNVSAPQFMAGKAALRTDTEETQGETIDLQAGLAVFQARMPTKEASARSTMAVTVETKYSQMNGDDVVQTQQTSKRKAIEIDDSHDALRKRRPLSDGQRPNRERSSAAPEKAASAYEDEAATVQDDSILSAPQQAIDDTQTPHPAEAQDHLTGDETLVGEDSEEHLPTYKVSPVNFRSSPPIPGTPSSSHSSTSAGPEPSPRSPISTSEAEEEEWEATLQPHQRALHDLLMRASKRALRHVVDNETAVTDIADVYANDGEHLVNEILQRQDGESKDMWEGMGSKKAVLKKEMTSSLRALTKERQRINQLS